VSSWERQVLLHWLAVLMQRAAGTRTERQARHGERAAAQGVDAGRRAYWSAKLNRGEPASTTLPTPGFRMPLAVRDERLIRFDSPWSSSESRMRLCRREGSLILSTPSEDGEHRWARDQP
jgi:hypothetical protein